MRQIKSKPELEISWLPFFHQWKEGGDYGDYGLWEYLRNTSNYDMAAAFSKLFWPDFVEVEGCIFVAEGYRSLAYSPEELNQRIQENPRRVEFTANYINIPYFFADNGIRGLKLVDPATSLYGPEEEIFPGELFVY